MPDLLFELFSEEIPARMQSQAASDLKKLVTDALMEAGLLYEGAVSFVTPRRLALHIAGLPARQPDQHEEKKGPRVGAPEAAIQGFLKSAGLTSLDQAQIVTDAKKGQFYIAHIERKGQPTQDVLAVILPSVIRSFPWPKSMRWGTTSLNADALRWVRPLHSIIATFGPETEDPIVIPFSIDGIASGTTTYGHRFMAPNALQVKRFDDYMSALEAAKVVLDPARRRDIILHDARDLAFAQGLELIEDEALLNEVAGLVEWPVVLMGEFDAAFLDIPPEVIRATIRANQKCFVLRDPQSGALSNKFLLVSNIIASDGGKAIVAGNERVVRARLSDALYFWQTDQKPLPDFAGSSAKPLDQRLAKLRALNIVFHEKLGTQGERVERIIRLARQIAQKIGADENQAARAAELSKADLMSEIVGEFPEVQGLMGRRYAELQGETHDVAIAIEDHYRPQGPSDRVPTNKIAIAVALADKIDTLVGFWAIDEKPTGSKDPYALRRAALGVIRLVLENDVRVKLLEIFNQAICYVFETKQSIYIDKVFEDANALSERYGRDDLAHVVKTSLTGNLIPDIPREEIEAGNFSSIDSSFAGSRYSSAIQATASDLLAFFHDRLKVYLRDKGARHDLIDAVLASGDNDDLVLIVRRVEALAALLDSEDGKNLLAGYKRAANIVRAEEKKDGAGTFDGAFDMALASADQEKQLSTTLQSVAKVVARSVASDNYAAAVQSLSTLRGPVDAFFEHVTVNDADAGVRHNRLCLLNHLRHVVHGLADFSKIAG